MNRRGISMTRGFVTIATGSEKYYKMARNLLRSYRLCCKQQVKFAVITDKPSKWTKEFDDVIILEHPTLSWMDKLSLLSNCPYDENIFIDADCLIYQDVNFFWDLFSSGTSFSCFGKSWDIETIDTNSWFTKQAQEYYPIKRLIHLHGIAYYIRKDKTTAAMQNLCSDIYRNYDKIQFKMFNGKPADEPIYALAMGIMDMVPVNRAPNYYCFVPYANRISTDFFKKQVVFHYPEEGDIQECCIVHWGNINTRKAQYQFERLKINYLYERKNIFKRLYSILFLKTKIAYCMLKITDGFKYVGKKIVYYWSRILWRLKIVK